MAGKIIKMINKIVDQRAQGNATIATTTRTKLLLKGINPEKFDNASADDPAIIEKLKNLAIDMGVTL